MIAPPHRDGNQNQLAAYRAVTRATNPISRSIEWMENHLAETISVDTLAAQVSMSPRTFMRRFQAAIGRPPMHWLTLRRIRRAQELLEESDRSVQWIAAATGFGTPELLRYHFRKSVGTSPIGWRQTRRLLDSDDAPIHS